MAKTNLGIMVGTHSPTVLKNILKELLWLNLSKLAQYILMKGYIIQLYFTSFCPHKVNTCFVAHSIIFIFIANLQFLITVCISSFSSISMLQVASPSNSMLSSRWVLENFSWILSRKKHLHKNQEKNENPSNHLKIYFCFAS